MKRRRGSSMLEGALVLLVFMILVVGTIDIGRLGFTYNSITFAAHQAARWASTNGSASGHPATLANIQTNAQNNLVGLDPGSLTVTASWVSNNNPGSKVKVVVQYGFQPLLTPISATKLTLKSTAQDYIVQ